MVYMLVMDSFSITKALEEVSFHGNTMVTVTEVTTPGMPLRGGCVYVVCCVCSDAACRCGAVKIGI